MVGAAIVWWLALPPRGWWVLFPLGVAVFMLALTGNRLRHRLWLGGVCGVLHYAIALRWVTDFSVPGYVAVVVVETVLLTVVAAVSPGDLAQRSRQPGWWLITPAALVLLEAVQHRFPFGGFPLPAFGYSQADGPFMAAAPVGGVLAVTALAALTGAVVPALILGPSRIRKASAVTAVLALAVPLSVAEAAGGTSAGTSDVVIVQGGGPRGLRAIDSDSMDATRRHLQTAEGITSTPDLVLLPENVVDVDRPISETSIGARFADLARQLDTHLVVGITEAEGDRFRNASVMWGPDGTQLGRYEKHHRVPFGEYIPVRDVFEWLSDDTRFVPRDAIVGDGTAVLQPSGLLRLGIVISYETFFPYRVAEAVRSGGQLILAPTNASSFVTDEVPAIEVAASRLRAREFGRTVLQAAPTGYSAVIQPDGTVTQLSGLSTSELLTATVPLRTGLTPYARMGDTPMLALAMLPLAWPAVARLTRRRGRKSADSTDRPAAAIASNSD